MAKTYQRTKLQEVTIRGYKSIAYDRPVTLKLGDVSILLGANGAGKSNIISFFRMLSYMMSKSFGRYVEISGTSHALLHYGIKRTPVMSGELKFADSKLQFSGHDRRTEVCRQQFHGCLWLFIGQCHSRQADYHGRADYMASQGGEKAL